jgi:hypothetical protein
MWVGLEHPATEKNAQGNGRRMPHRAPTQITKKGKEEGRSYWSNRWHVPDKTEARVEREKKEARWTGLEVQNIVWAELNAISERYLGHVLLQKEGGVFKIYHPKN